MKKFYAVLLAIMFVMLVTPVFASEMTLNAKATAVSIAQDKNGQEYVRAIVDEKRTASGVEYTIGVPVMYFGEHAKLGKLLKPGDMVKAIVKARIYQGAESYTVIKPLK